MKVTPIQTPIVHVGDDVLAIIAQSISSIPEKSVLVITSKIVALSEGAVVERKLGTKEEKWQAVREQAELYTDPNSSVYQLMLTVKHQILAVNAGIDESNSDGTYVLLPQDPYASAAKIWHFLREKYGLKEVGVLLIDSKTLPLKWGTIGTALAHCGFEPLNDRRGEKDLFGHEMVMTRENIAEGLAVAANLEMGEVAEAQPLCLITGSTKIEFVDHPPTQDEIEALSISLEDDAYAPILTRAPWQRGGSQS